MLFSPLRSLCLLLLLTLQASGHSRAAQAWIADFDRAQEVARETGKDLFVDFTGSDWCGWCTKLDNEVFSFAKFKQAIARDYVMVKIDLPRKPSALSRVPDIARNRALVKQYGVRSYPTVLLMTAEGEVYGRTGYREGGPEAFVEHIASLRSEGRPPLIAAAELSAKFEAAEPSSRPALVDAAIVQLRAAKAGSAVAGKLAAIAKHALVLDAKDESGLARRALAALLPSGHATDLQLERAREWDPKNEAGLLELAVLAELMRVKNEAQVRAILVKIDALDALGPIIDSQAALTIYSNAAQWQQSFRRDRVAARKYALKAKPLAKGNQALSRKLDTLLRG